MHISEAPNIENKSPAMLLTEQTRKLLKNRPVTQTFKVISGQTGLSIGWLQHFMSSPDRDPGADKVQTLYEFLSGRPLLQSTEN